MAAEAMGPSVPAGWHAKKSYIDLTTEQMFSLLCGGVIIVQDLGEETDGQYRILY